MITLSKHTFGCSQLFFIQIYMETHFSLWHVEYPIQRQLQLCYLSGLFTPYPGGPGHRGTFTCKFNIHKASGSVIAVDGTLKWAAPLHSTCVPVMWWYRNMYESVSCLPYSSYSCRLAERSRNKVTINHVWEVTGSQIKRRSLWTEQSSRLFCAFTPLPLRRFLPVSV